MKKIIVFAVSAVILSFFTLFVLSRIVNYSAEIVSGIAERKESLGLEKYSFENLKRAHFKPLEITFEKLILDEDSFSSYLFFFLDPEGKKVSGLANLPKNKTSASVVILFRGYVDREIYETGIGTKHVGEFFARNGLITLAPDFLGYGESDMPSDDSLEERFQTYTTALSLIASIANLNSALKKIDNNLITNTESIGIWGHSNGGQIALSVLAITGSNYPTVLWAPVSKPFPYSILYFTDDFDDHGKMLRKIVSDFEKDYEAEKYSPANYYSWIKGPVELHQGSNDEAVPRKWSDELYEKLLNLDINISYFVYPFEDHNFSRGSWQTVASRSLTFFTKHLYPSYAGLQPIGLPKQLRGVYPSYSGLKLQSSEKQIRWVYTE